MIFRSVTSRLVLSYCLLLVLLGGAFLAFTVLSFRHYTRETLSNTLVTRAREIWNISESSLNQPARLAEIISRRFSPEAQDRFIRIRVGDTVLYRSGTPIGGDFAPLTVPIVEPGTDAGPQTKMLGNLLLYSHSFQDEAGRTITVDTGQSYLFARTVQARLATSLFVGLPLLLLLAALAGVVLMRRALTPVEAMINAAETYTFNDPHKRL
ncbi:MAG TPA: hypothetical protein VNY75_06735, partial [Rhizomicrobium sp.]|nr:hypothetical protein [Rhizomicrobium sp.]